MALIDKLTAIADGFRASRGITGKLPLEKMAELAAERVGAAEAIAHADIPDYVKAAALDVAQKVSDLRTDDSIVFLAMSDSHHAGEQDNTSWQEYTNTGNLHASQAAKVLAYTLDMDFVCHLGDITFGDKTTTSDQLHQQIAEMTGWLDEAFKGIPQLWTVGNHDTGLYAYKNGAETALETPEYLFTAIGSRCDGAVYGSERFGYCYRDFEAKKLRVICLNTSEGENLAGYDAAYVCSPDQLLWFAQTLRDVGSREDAADWSVMVLGHYPLDYLGTHPASTVVKAYVEGGSTTQNGTTVNFAAANYAKFVADFHGHTHCFKAAKLNTIDTSASTAAEFDAWRVAVPNAGFYRNNHQSGPDKYGLYFEEDTTYDKTIDGAQDTAFVVNVVIPSKQVIHSICYGAGYDRVIGYGATVYHSVSTTLTNVTLSNNIVAIENGATFESDIIVADGYDLVAVTISMGGEDVTSAAYADGKITISEVYGDIQIVAKAVLHTNYTNQIPISTDENGNIYGEDYDSDGTADGYKSDYRLSSSGTESKQSGMYLTGFIPCKFGDLIYLKNVTFQYGSSTAGNQRLSFYDADKNHLAQTNATGASALDKDNDSVYDVLKDENGIYTMLCVGILSGVDSTNAAYFRINAAYIGSDSVITVNEIIE